LEREVVVEVGVGIEAELGNRCEVLGEVLNQSAELSGGWVTFSLVGVLARKVMREAMTLLTWPNDVIIES
jgi:hypothetical protein